MAQWIRRPPTERKIPGSIPGVEAPILPIQRESLKFWHPTSSASTSLPVNQNCLQSTGLIHDVAIQAA